MIKLENQIITVRGKRVEFDALPLKVQEKLLSLWKIKIKSNGRANKGKTRSRKKTS